MDDHEPLGIDVIEPPPNGDQGAPVDESGALRAYLQRAEVRLSTMHRVAGALLGGAGLLVLLPVLLRDSIPGLLNTVLASDADLAARDQGLLLASIGIIVVLPLLFMLSLVRDLVHFYFTSDHPVDERGGLKGNFLPLFVLSSLTPPDDRFAQRLFRHEKALLPFVMGHQRGEQYKTLREQTSWGIVPEPLFARARYIERRDPDMADFYTALGLGAYAERSSEFEAAKMVASLTRHSIYLRRLLIRYLKSLTLSVWIFVALLTTSSIATSEAVSDSDRVAAVTACVIATAVLSPFIAHLPIVFAYQITDANLPLISPPDSHMRRLEVLVFGSAALAITLATFPLASLTNIVPRSDVGDFAGLLSLSMAALAGFRALGAQIVYAFSR